MISIIDPLENRQWLHFISCQEKASIFHHPAWLSVLQLQYGFRVFAVCSLNERGAITTGIPFCEVRGITGKKRWVSLPFSDMCPLLSDDDQSLKEVLDYCIGKKEAKETESIEIRDLLPQQSQFEKRTDAVSHSVNLTGNLDSLFRSFDKSQVQRGIMKARREGLSTVISNEYSGIDEFYRLHLQTRKKLGAPIQPKGFFRHFFQEIIKAGLGSTILVYSESRCIAAGIFCGFGKVFTYKYGASDKHYLKLRPNHLMFWTAMEEAVTKGFTSFDFGKTENENAGLRVFKSGWGSVESPLYYSYYPAAPSGRMMKIIREKVVAPVIRNSPEFVCRLTGELFYKYFA